jgi:hypothetical protein
MRRANEEKVTMSMMAYLMGAEARLDSHPLGLAENRRIHRTELRDRFRAR